MNDHYPHVTVATVVQKNNKFLLVEEHSDQGKVFNQPAGHLEIGETLFEAALRETLEETGWEVTLTGLLGVSQYWSPQNNITYIRLSFAADPIKQLPDARLDAGIIRACWLPLVEIEKLPNLRSPMVLDDIRRYCTGAIYPLSLVHTQSFAPMI